MAGTKVLNENAIALGTGWLEYEQWSATGTAFATLRNLGSTPGPIKINPKREKKTYEEGTPKQEVVVDITKEGYEIEITLVEVSPDDLKFMLGGGTVASENAASSEQIVEAKTLTDTGWQNLSGWGGSANSNTLAISSVKSQDPTPVTYVKDTDYKEDLIEGRIRRIAGGSITSGQTVDVTFTWNKPAGRALTVGGANSIQYYRFKHTFERRDGSREVHWFYKAATAGDISIDYNASDYRKVNLKITGIADSARTAGDQLYKYKVFEA